MATTAGPVLIRTLGTPDTEPVWHPAGWILAPLLFRHDPAVLSRLWGAHHDCGAQTPGHHRHRGATGTTVRVFGVLAAFVGVEHGLGEGSQGPVATPAVVFKTWPHVAAFDPLNGEPAMSLIPNPAVPGMLSVLVALALGAVAFRFPDRPHSGPFLIGLSLVLLW